MLPSSSRTRRRELITAILDDRIAPEMMPPRPNVTTNAPSDRGRRSVGVEPADGTARQLPRPGRSASGSPLRCRGDGRRCRLPEVEAADLHAAGGNRRKGPGIDRRVEILQNAPPCPPRTPCRRGRCRRISAARRRATETERPGPSPSPRLYTTHSYLSQNACRISTDPHDYSGPYIAGSRVADTSGRADPRPELSDGGDSARCRAPTCRRRGASCGAHSGHFSALPTRRISGPIATHVYGRLRGGAHCRLCRRKGR